MRSILVDTPSGPMSLVRRVSTYDLMCSMSVSRDHWSGPCWRKANTLDMSATICLTSLGGLDPPSKETRLEYNCKSSGCISLYLAKCRVEPLFFGPYILLKRYLVRCSMQYAVVVCSEYSSVHLHDVTC